MRVFVTGATGLIGSAVVAGLAAAGHAVVAVARDGRRAAALAGTAEVVPLDLRHATRAEDWLARLAGVEAVVNCAGVLQDGPRDAVVDVQDRSVRALFEACERAGVRRVVHVSAIGVDRAASTVFTRTKRAADEALAATRLDWVILRPSVVVGAAAYGGSALFRGLAALPVLPVPPETGPLQVVQLADLVRTVVFFLEPGTPARIALDVAGPETLAFAEVVAAYRRWLGWPPARRIAMPKALAGLVFALGDLAGRLGWRSPMRSTARLEIRQGATGDPRAWSEITGIRPQSLGEALALRPASVQERWFAGLYLVKPVVFTVLSLFWIVTGLISLGPGRDGGVAILEAAGAGPLAAPAATAGALADIAVGAAIAVRRTARAGLWAAVAVTAFYLAVAALLAPGLWADPLGPIVKVFPALVLHLVALTILQDR